MVSNEAKHKGGTQEVGFTIGVVTSESRIQNGHFARISANGYSDWSGDIVSKKSQGGYMIQLSGRQVAWRSFNQRCVAASNPEIEYVYLAEYKQKIRYFHYALGKPEGLHVPSIIYEDN